MTAESVVFAICCGISIILLIVPFLWQVRKHNVAASLLVLWLQLSILMCMADAIIWPDYKSTITGFQGAVYCDLVIKLKIAAEWGGVNASVMCIMITIYRMFWSVGMYRETHRSKRIRMWYEWGLAGLFPLVLAGIHYIVQPNRYYLVPVTGCAPSVDNSWVSIILVGWPMIFSTVSLVLVGFIMWKLHKHMQERSLLGLFRSNSQLDASFKRLYLVVGLFTLIYYPTNLYTIIQFCISPMLPYKWDAVHADWWDNIYRFPDNRHFQYQRWIKIVAAWILFIIFGRGGEAVAIYWDIAALLHVTKEVEIVVNNYKLFKWTVKYIWLPRIKTEWFARGERMQSLHGSASEAAGEKYSGWRSWRVVRWIQGRQKRHRRGAIHLGSDSSFGNSIVMNEKPRLSMKNRIITMIRSIGKPKIHFEFSITWIRDSFYNSSPTFTFSRYRLDVPETPTFCETFDTTTLETIAKQASHEVDSSFPSLKRVSTDLTRIDTSDTLLHHSKTPRKSSISSLAIMQGLHSMDSQTEGEQTGLESNYSQCQTELGTNETGESSTVASRPEGEGRSTRITPPKRVARII